MSDATDAARCGSCGEPADPEARFCEVCGSALLEPSAPASPASPASAALATSATSPTGFLPVPGAMAPSSSTDGPAVGVPAGAVTVAVPNGMCSACGGGDGYDVDGFCIACGVRSVRPRDRMELDLGGVNGSGGLVAVSDKGPRKVRNEDSFALARLAENPAAGNGSGGWVMSVCDGVSNIPRSDEASQAASDAAVAVLSGIPAGTIEQLHVAAAAAASAAVVGLAPASRRGGNGGIEPPSCTYLTVRWHPAEGISVGWLGDCRAYVIEAGVVQQLTVDHSWGTQAVAAGVLSQVDADRDARSHAITRWLGADAQLEPIPEMVRHQISGPALVVAVSDGAWNYLDSNDQVAQFFADGDVLGGARRLTQHAIDRGGHDNITVAAATLQPEAATLQPEAGLPAGTVPVSPTTLSVEHS